ncbi:MAG: hypothetical protein K2X86_11440, partial [Cytophagaceae bacterium]|nr:hypothetical protein [Cytophagaceae bacterium]
MIRIFSLLVAMLSAVAVFSQSISEGVRMMEVDKMDAAKKVFYSLYKKTPSAEHAWYLGNVYYEQANADSALFYFNE